MSAASTICMRSQAIRRMDEVLINNFMVFSDVVRVGVLRSGHRRRGLGCRPFPAREPRTQAVPLRLADRLRRLVADARRRRPGAVPHRRSNAEMLEHRARFRAVRDRSIFVGNPADVVAGSVRPRPAAYQRVGASRTSTSPATSPVSTPSALEIRQRCAHAGAATRTSGCASSPSAGPASEPTCSAGCSTRSRSSGHRFPIFDFLVVAGPRIDPAFSAGAGRDHGGGLVPDLYRDLAACDVAVVQGGLTTCMELTAAGTPFVYVPLRHHFEQNIHVRRRLQQYGAGICLPYEQASIPELLAGAVLDAVATTPRHRTVGDGWCTAGGLDARRIALSHDGR